MPSNTSVMAVVKDAQRVDELGRAYDDAIELAQKALRGEALPPWQLELARAVIATWAKVRQTDNARAALNFMMSRHLAVDKGELATFVMEVAPQDAIAGALTKRANGAT